MLRLLGFIIQVFLLCVLGCIVAGLYFFFEKLGSKGLPVAFLTLTFGRRLITILYISSRYTHDSRSVIDRIENPEKYRGYKLTFDDKVSIFVMRNFKTMRNFTDFRKYPFPFNLWEGERIGWYLRKTSLWTSLVCIFCVCWILEIFDGYWDKILWTWGLFIAVGAVIRYYSSRKNKWNKIFKKRFRFIYLSLEEFLEKISFGIIIRSSKISGIRLLCCIVVGLVVMSSPELFSILYAKIKEGLIIN